MSPRRRGARWSCLPAPRPAPMSTSHTTDRQAPVVLWAPLPWPRGFPGTQPHDVNSESRWDAAVGVREGSRARPLRRIDGIAHREAGRARDPCTECSAP